MRLHNPCYQYGTGVAKDEAEATKWYYKATEWNRKAAEQGYVEVQHALGSCYQCGTGGEQKP